MFKVGDTVRNVAANIVGVVVEIEGDTVYLEQSNGAEVDFAVSDLVLENAFQEKHGGSGGTDDGPSENDAVYAAVLGNIYPAIVDMGRLSYVQAERAPGVAPKDWDALNSLQKLNAISEATNVPVKTWIEANQPGAKTPIGAFQLSLLAEIRKKT